MIFAGDDAKGGRPITPLRNFVTFIWNDARKGFMAAEADCLADIADQKPVAVCDPCTPGDPVWRRRFAAIREAWENARASGPAIRRARQPGADGSD